MSSKETQNDSTTRLDMITILVKQIIHLPNTSKKIPLKIVEG